MPKTTIKAKSAVTTQFQFTLSVQGGQKKEAITPPKRKAHATTTVTPAFAEGFCGWILKAVAKTAEHSPQTTAIGENFKPEKSPSVTISATPAAANTAQMHSTDVIFVPLVSANHSPASIGLSVRNIAAVPALEYEID